MTRQVHFLLCESMQGYVFNPHRSDGLSFTDKTTNVEVQIVPRGKEGDFGYGHSNLELRVKASRDVTENQLSFLETLLNERILRPEQTPIALPYVNHLGEVVTSDGKIAEGYSLALEFLPKDMQELCISTAKELEENAVRFVQVLRWLEKADGPVNVRDVGEQCFGIYWGTTEEKYHHVPLPGKGPFEATAIWGGFGGLTWSDEDQQTFADLWRNRSENEPLGHQLLREAKGIVEHNSRSALLICYSALEVGIKQHISKCAPHAAWLAMYAPTPPLFNILRDYLPKIHIGKQDFKEWNNIKPELGIIKKFVDDRNKLAHRGENTSESLDEYLRITEDLLYAFDVFEGHNWAKTRVSSRFGRLLGWHSANNIP